jgi:hypothetical protein
LFIQYQAKTWNERMRMPRDLKIASQADIDDELPEAGLIALIHCIFFLLAGFMVAGMFEQEAPQNVWQSPLALPRCQPVQPAINQVRWQRPPVPVSSRQVPASCP